MSGRTEALTSLRATLDWLGDEVRTIAEPVDPVLEATAINKAFDDGPVFLMDRVAGYPNARLVASLWGRKDRVRRRQPAFVLPDELPRAAGGKGQAYMPAERMTPTEQVSMFEGGLGIDATVPIAAREHFARARYPVDKIDFSKWFTEAEMAEMRATQSEYLRFLGRTGLA